jgi:hypothetical protein
LIDMLAPVMKATWQRDLALTRKATALPIYFGFSLGIRPR